MRSCSVSVSRSGKGSNERNYQTQPRGWDRRRIGKDSTQVAINKLFGPDKTQCLLICRGKKCFSMTNMKMIDQVCYSLCDKFSTITAFCHDLLCKEGSVRHYYRDNDTFTFSIYTKYLHLHYVSSLRFGFLKYSTVLLTVQRQGRTNDQASHYLRHMPLSPVCQILSSCDPPPFSTQKI